MAQGIVAFQQRLYDKEKAEEVVNLHQVMIIVMSIMMAMLSASKTMTMLQKLGYDDEDATQVREEARELAIKFGELAEAEEAEGRSTSYHQM